MSSWRYDQDGQHDKVQYFQRAVFEYHPENPPPFDVLLSQLGTARYKDKYLTPPTATPAPATPVPPMATPTTVAPPHAYQHSVGRARLFGNTGPVKSPSPRTAEPGGTVFEFRAGALRPVNRCGHIRHRTGPISLRRAIPRNSRMARQSKRPHALVRFVIPSRRVGQYHGGHAIAR